MSIVKGVAPGFLLLPAREYNYELKDRIRITLPQAGQLSSFMDDNTLADGVKLELEDDFALFEDNTFYLWQTVGVLFAQAKYPKLADDEMVNIVAIEKTEDKIILHGEILKCIA